MNNLAPLFLSYTWTDCEALWAPDSPQVWIWYFVWHGTVALRCTLVGVGQSQTFNFSKKRYLANEGLPDAVRCIIFRSCELTQLSLDVWIMQHCLTFMYSNMNVNRIRAGIRQIQQGASEQKTVFPPFIFTVFHVGFEARMVLITCKHWNLSHFWVGWVYRT